MAVLGRILQAIGWVWLALGFFGPILNLPIDVNFFPGIILIFIARIFRAQAARRESQEAEAQASEVEQSQPRALNTERTRSQPPSPGPTNRPEPEPNRPEAAKPRPEAKRQEMLEQVLLAGTELATESTPQPDTSGVEETPASTRPLSSAEMIARAHKRWNKRP